MSGQAEVLGVEGSLPTGRERTDDTRQGWLPALLQVQGVVSVSPDFRIL